MKSYRTLNLPFVLYGCETWSFTLREERRLRFFENRVLRRIFGSKRDEVTGNEKNNKMRSLVFCIYHKIFSGDKIKKNELVGSLARMGEGEMFVRFGWEFQAEETIWKTLN